MCKTRQRFLRNSEQRNAIKLESFPSIYGKIRNEPKYLFSLAVLLILATDLVTASKHSLMLQYIDGSDNFFHTDTEHGWVRDQELPTPREICAKPPFLGLLAVRWFVAVGYVLLLCRD